MWSMQLTADLTWWRKALLLQLLSSWHTRTCLNYVNYFYIILIYFYFRYREIFSFLTSAHHVSTICTMQPTIIYLRFQLAASTKQWDSHKYRVKKMNVSMYVCIHYIYRYIYIHTHIYVCVCALCAHLYVYIYVV